MLWLIRKSFYAVIYFVKSGQWQKCPKMNKCCCFNVKQWFTQTHRLRHIVFTTCTQTTISGHTFVFTYKKHIHVILDILSYLLCEEISCVD